MFTRVRRLRAILAAVVVALLLTPTAALADPAAAYDFAGPIFGLAVAPDDSLLVADGGAGIVELRNGGGRLVASLPGVTDVAPIGRGDMFAITGGGDGPSAARLFRVSQGGVRELADLGAFEATVNPDGAEINPNPFDVAVLSGGAALVADAGANALLIVDQQGRVDWVATLPQQLASSANLQALAGCPTPPPDFAFICGLPPMLPAQAVATSVAVGPDGAYYVGELTGVPAPTGMSRVWRIEPGTRHAQCGASPACTVVAGGFTSIIDLAFGPDGALYVVEMDEATWAAVELGLGGTGGTVNRCAPSTWACTAVATGLSMPVAVAVDRHGTLHAVIDALTPAAQVVALP